MRSDGRKNDQIRHAKITRNYKTCRGSVLIVEILCNFVLHQ